MELLDAEDILAMHQSAIDNFGGSKGFYSDTIEKIQSILSQQHSHFGYDKYPSIFDKAAMLWYFFTKDHCFVDGNKRVGFYAAATLLGINGYVDQLDDDAGYDKAIQIACSDFSGVELDQFLMELADWLRQNFLD